MHKDTILQQINIYLRFKQLYLFTKFYDYLNFGKKDLI